ncbi:YbfB/YjiJ family MFS transporter [Alloalcanivorax gelatiniphagus]|uniref:YbfB/YjiJ family MFS transporter n=1 Tax=Alloalcanivorax gelatiniphagus TaxID=1194167 RepID=A0ABY2XJJ8_9GAMM|nr:YbfB/YjiJ family MFS transporter [Alloalcanivorax gelatiniphagus]TMW11287.1 YbfB/YjiJ family MFS transporter [Alloalcanivorax gelatiniphagus]
MSSHAPIPSPVRLVAMAASATLVGIGLGRFAYAALLPGVIQRGWLSEADAGYVGAANLLGYLVGAVLAGRVGRRWGTTPVIRLSAVLVAVGFAASAWPGPVWWFSLWRFVAGVTGAFLMVLAPSLIASHLPESMRKRGTTWIFTGVGVGVLFSATLVPLLIESGLMLAWLGLALACLPPILVLWRPWPPVAGASPHQQGPGRGAGLLLLVVYLAYLMDAVGFVPHTVFWVDYLERQRGFSHWAAALQWGVFAVGAVSGPFLAGAMARRLGWHRTLITALTLKGTGVLLPMLVPGIAAVTASSFLVGAMIPTMVSGIMGRTAELVPPRLATQAWGRATALFAVGQAGAAYALAALYARPGGAPLTFEIGGATLLAAALLVALSGVVAHHTARHS